MQNRLLNIPESVSLAFHSLRIIVNSNNNVSASEIAKKTGLSVNHLSKILRKLVVANILSVSKGPGGGFHLTKSNQNISLLSIYEIFAPLPSDNNCIYQNPICDKNNCIFDNILCDINKKFISYLQNKKISEL